MRVAMLTPVEEGQDVADYARHLIAGLQTVPDVTVEIVPIHLGRQTREHYLAQSERLNAPEIDVIHIHFRHTFWGDITPDTNGYWELRYLMKKPVVLTAHETDSAAELLKINAEHNPIRRLKKQILLRNRAYVDSLEIAPFATALTIVHTPTERERLLERGAKPGYVAVIPDDASPLRFRATRNVYKRAIEIYAEGPHHPQVTVPAR